jgi:hypothetical protein
VLLLVYRKNLRSYPHAGAKSLPRKNGPQCPPRPRSSQKQEEKATLFFCVRKEKLLTESKAFLRGEYKMA